MKLKVDAEGRTVATITADNKSTLDLLQRDARGLEQALADAGLTTDSGGLDFNLRGDGNGEEDANHASGSYSSPLPEEDELAPLEVLSQNYTVNVTDGLDIKI